MDTPSHDRISVIIPVFNEEVNLAGCLDTLADTFGGWPLEIVVVDDGSSDGTLAVAQQWARTHPGIVRALSHERNQGIGGALRTGIGAATGDSIMTCPADFHFGHNEWAPYAAALNQADVIVGCRRRREGYNPLMQFNAWIYPKLVHTLFGLRLRDVNWICVYRRDLLAQVEITQRGIPMLAEILVKLRDLGATFCEVDCRMQSRVTGTPTAARFKVMWETLAGLLAFWWTYRKGPRAVPPRNPAAATNVEDRAIGDLP
jgi:glycosyltransferase involved in cell wall biosynthesis